MFTAANPDSEDASDTIPCRYPAGSELTITPNTPLLAGYGEADHNRQVMQQAHNMKASEEGPNVNHVSSGTGKSKEPLVRLQHVKSRMGIRFSIKLGGGDVVSVSDLVSSLPSTNDSQLFFPIKKKGLTSEEAEINRLALQKDGPIMIAATTGSKKGNVAPLLCDVVSLLFALTHVILWAVVIALNLPPLVRDDWLAMLRLLRSPLLLSTWFYLLGVNMAVWAASDINYSSLLEAPRSFLTPTCICSTSGVITAMLGLFVSVFMFLVAAEFDKAAVVLELLSWGLVTLYLLNPLRIFCRKERFTFLASMGRTFLAPFFKVRFLDAWLADQLVSLIVIMLDLEYSVCYFVGSAGYYDTGVCTGNVGYIRTIITVLPSTWRYLQCLRSYYDTKETKHLWNAVKYFTAYPVVFFATFYQPKSGNDWLFSFREFDFDLDDGIVFVLWGLSAFVNAAYSFAWDVIYDWDLLSFQNARPVRRSLRLYRPTCWYVVAVILDFALRFLWTAKISLAVLYHHNVDLVFTALTFAEVFRRFFWNFIRFEIQWIRTAKEDDTLQ